MTTAYWFDLDGTLVGYDRSFDTLLEETLGGEQPATVHETFREALFVAFETFEAAPFEQGFEALVEVHDLAIDPAQTATTFREHELRATQPVEGATTILEAVRSLGPVGIITNGDGALQRAKLDHHGLDPLVDEVIISNEVEVSKPDPEIFDIARQRMDATEHVYVGDTFEEDIAGARDAGFEAVHVRHDEGPSISLDRLASIGLFLEAPSTPINGSTE